MLATVTLLLLLSSTILAYSAKISMAKNRISLNTQNHVTAENLAAMGSFQLLSQISEQPLEKLSEQTLMIKGQGQIVIDMQNTQTERFNQQMHIIEIRSKGTSVDNLATVNLSQLVISYPLLRTLPKAPLIVGKSLSIESKLTLVADPNGAGTGLPLSLWMANELDMATLELVSCQLYEYLTNDCEVSPLSGEHNKNSDIIDNPDTFPNDIFAYLTNLPAKYRTQFMDEADKVISRCEDLSRANSGLIWVKGNCKLLKDTTVGTTEDPVMLIVDKGSLTFADNTKIVGMVMMLTPLDSILAAQIHVNGAAVIDGALIATESIAVNNQPLTIKYNADVINNFHQDPNNWRIARVPSSWRNF
ncbi:hypothetical protein AB6T38_00350 [Aliiglaciecola sp. SL4]|uniref:hypothetical protein n=1 Tax=Aliiglaciecola sp. SL4 TaxID=3239806 RepID=UPI00355B21B3